VTYTSEQLAEALAAAARYWEHEARSMLVGATERYRYSVHVHDDVARLRPRPVGPVVG
jgi:hypothetical protein